MINRCCIIIAALLLTTQLSFGQKFYTINFPNAKTNTMKTYVIERDFPGAGKLNAQQLKEIAQQSCKTLHEMGSSIKWIQSYVAGEKFYCIYQAENEELVRRHAKLAGFPCNLVAEVANVISPKTAE